MVLLQVKRSTFKRFMFNRQIKIKEMGMNIKLRRIEENE